MVSLTALLLSLSLLLVCTSAQPLLRTINVAGTGRATAEPDVATVDTGVISNAPTAGKALIANTKRFSQVLKVLADLGVDKKDVQTSYFDVSPRYKPRTRQTVIIGYRVDNQVTVKVRDVDSLGAVLDALIKAGSNSISNVSFSIDDPEIITNQARVSAIKDARNRAALYAKTAGVKVGPVISISETVIETPDSRLRRGAAAFGSSSALLAASVVPISSGQLDVETNVFMLFEMA